MCPLGTDQTTRTSQRWALMCPRLRQQHKLSSGHEHRSSGGTWSHSECDGGWDAWAKLARPDPLALSCAAAGNGERDEDMGKLTRNGRRRGLGKGAASDVPATDDVIADACRRPTESHHPVLATHALSPLESLPYELSYLIISHLSPETLLSLAQTSRTLLALILPYITTILQSAAAPWANSEIAAIGTWLTSFPPPFVKDNLAFRVVEAELPGIVERAADEAKNKLSGNHWRPCRGMCVARQANWRARGVFSECGPTAPSAWHASEKHVEDVREVWKSALLVVEDFADETAPRRLRSEIERVVLGEYLFPTGAVWVLRNLDSREIVKCEARLGKGTTGLEGWVGPKHKSKARQLRLDDVLLTRINWGSGEGARWAGHRFEIVSERMHKMEEGVWEDVTKLLLMETRQAMKKSLNGF